MRYGVIMLQVVRAQGEVVKGLIGSNIADARFGLFYFLNQNVTKSEPNQAPGLRLSSEGWNPGYCG
jgi:hypothetical protein